MLNKFKIYFFRKKYEKLSKQYLHMPPLEEFSVVMSNINEWLSFVAECRSTIEVIHIVNYLIDIIKDDIRTSAGTEMIFCTDITACREWRHALYPFSHLFHSVENKYISTYKKTIISSPEDWGKLYKACNHIAQNGFLTSLNNYTGQYYPELDMIFISNGLHHSCVAAQLNEVGEIRVDVCLLSPCFHRITTDGKYWYDKELPDWKSDVHDVRMAILFELAKKKHDVMQVQNVAKRNESIQMILDAIEDDFRKVYSIDHNILTNILTPELIISIAKRSRVVIGQSNSIIAIIPAQFYTEEFFMIAVARNGLAIKDIPDKHYSESLCELAVKQHGEALKYIPYRFLTPELCILAVEEFGMALRYVPNSWIDLKMVRLALKTAPKAIFLVPTQLLCDDFWIYVMARHPTIINELLPKKVRERIILITE